MKKILILIVLLSIITVFACYTVPKSMAATVIYQYTWKTGFDFTANEWGFAHTETEVREDTKNGISKNILQQFAAKFAELGRWFIVDSINVNVTSLYRDPISIHGYKDYITGTATMIFRSDATPDEDFYPQSGFVGWLALLEIIIATTISIILAHSTLFFILLIIIALTIFTLAGGFKGVIFGAGSGGITADIGTIVIILAVAFLGFTYFSRRGKNQ